MKTGENTIISRPVFSSFGPFKRPKEKGAPLKEPENIKEDLLIFFKNKWGYGNFYCDLYMKW